MIAAVADPEQLKEVFEDLIVSMLAVNNYSLSKAYSLCGRLREVGLCDLAFAPGEAPCAQDIYDKLVAAGYIRGEYIGNLISERLAAIISVIKEKGCSEFLSGLLVDSALIEERLSGLYGVGPKVISNFVSLRCMTGSRCG